MGYKIVRALLNFIFFGLFGLHVEGRENVPSTGAVIVAPNHKSDWDPPLIGVAFNTRIIHYMAKEELFKNPIFGWLIRQFGTFPVKRGDCGPHGYKAGHPGNQGRQSAGHISGRHPD